VAVSISTLSWRAEEGRPRSSRRRASAEASAARTAAQASAAFSTDRASDKLLVLDSACLPVHDLRTLMAQRSLASLHPPVDGSSTVMGHVFGPWPSPTPWCEVPRPRRLLMWRGHT
jgi:hypothetical protein